MSMKKHIQSPLTAHRVSLALLSPTHTLVYWNHLHAFLSIVELGDFHCLQCPELVTLGKSEIHHELDTWNNYLIRTNFYVFLISRFFICCILWILIFAISRKRCVRNVFNFAILSFGCVSQKGIFTSHLDRIRRNCFFCYAERNKFKTCRRRS